MSEALKSVIEFCFSKTELQKIWTDVHILNHVSYKTLEKVGFSKGRTYSRGKNGRIPIATTTYMEF